ncbi:MAG: hypothetical protein M3Y72_19960, partial [Acidobacteriota bacterium]|nr:hypothetical protein [Acidobacteriota bacterium]
TTDMNGEGKLRTELIKTGIPSYEWPSSDGQVNYKLPQNLQAKRQLLDNLGLVEENADCLHLEGWEARLYAL